MNEIGQLKEKLIKLHMRAAAQNLEHILKEARDKNLSLICSVQRLVDLEVERRWQNAVKLRWDQSGLCEKPSIDQFDSTTINHERSRKTESFIFWTCSL